MRLPHFDRKEEPLRSSPSPEGKGDSILRFIAITRDEEFYGALARIAQSCQWQIARAATIEDAVVLIKGDPAPLIVYEGDPDDKNWRPAFKRLNELPEHPCILLASSVADENLLNEVVRNSGYDILPKSAPKEKLIRCLHFAWCSALARSARAR